MFTKLTETPTNYKADLQVENLYLGLVGSPPDLETICGETRPRTSCSVE